MEVTQAHYTELQKRLQEENPDRGSPEYDGFYHDVKSIKLGVLGSTFSAEAFSPRHPNNNEDRAGDDEDPGSSIEDPGASNEGSGESNEGPGGSNEGGSGIDGDGLGGGIVDDSDINSFLPFTLRFLDLSTLDLKEEVPGHVPLPLFFRQEYDDISALIEKGPKNGSVIVSGQPGTGEVLVSLSHRI